MIYPTGYALKFSRNAFMIQVPYQGIYNANNLEHLKRIEQSLPY